MEITIRTEDILGAKEELREDVVRMAVTEMKAEVRQQATDMLHKLVTDEVAEVVLEEVRRVVENHLDTPYKVRDGFGRDAEELTLRERIALHLQEQCKFKVDYGNSTIFTELVKKTVETEMRSYQKAFNTLVTDRFVAEAMQHAVNNLRKRMGVE